MTKKDRIEIKKNHLYFDRELSWLQFNHRVLQEAKDPRVPLMERLKFLAIYSSNLDEFYRVRVASLRSLKKLRKENKHLHLSFSPKKLLKKINKVVNEQQNEFGRIFRQELIPKLTKHNIHLVNEKLLTARQKTFIKEYFDEKIIPKLNPQKLELGKPVPFLENKVIYMVASYLSKGYIDNIKSLEYFLLKVPEDLPRFIEIPGEDGEHVVIFIDDIIRYCTYRLSNEMVAKECYSVKLSRDAELYLEDELQGDLVEQINKSLEKREKGVPSRFLFDHDMPKYFLKHLKNVLQLKSSASVPIPGGRYHNFNDFFSFPVPKLPSLFYQPQPPVTHTTLEKYSGIFDAVREEDVLLHFPYQTYTYIVRAIEEAANDPYVISIKISLYRVAKKSKIGEALITAAENGKEVIVFDEIKARFDEAPNLYWGEKFSRAGIKVIYSHKDLKVHTKLFIVERKKESNKEHFVFLGTGNFNEDTAKLYSDFALLTSNKLLAEETNKVFDLLENVDKKLSFNHLLVAPHEMRSKFEALIDNEIKHAKAGKKAKIILKLNSLEDKLMIDKLYEASRAGVRIKIIVRGICCLIPNQKINRNNIEIISIIDRYLEHSRAYIFHNNGEELYYLASADWMERNLSRRVEVAFPIWNKELQVILKDFINLQLKDNTKARIIDQLQTNQYKDSVGEERIRAQYETYNYLKNKELSTYEQLTNEKALLDIQKTTTDI